VPTAEPIGLGDDLDQWEGVLVEVQDVEVTEAPNSYGEFAISDGSGDGTVGGLFFAADHWADYPIQVGDQFSAIVGVINYSFETYMIEPRTDGDLTQ
jgi:hypothetical protein